MARFLASALCLIAAILPSPAYAGGGAEVLTEDTFDARTSSGGVWLVKFYAPWCGHCKSLAPVFDKLTSDEALKGKDVHIGKVDCTVEKTVCQRFDVKSYPTLKVVTEKLSFDYVGQRDRSAMVEFALGGYKSSLGEDVLTLAQFQEKTKREEQELIDAEKASMVVTLSSTSFDEHVHEKSAPWLLKFYAPWCGHCKRLAPVWDKLSAELNAKNDPTRVGKIDCTKYRRVCSRFSVNGYPSLFYVRDGQVYPYEGARSLEGFHEFVSSGYKKVESTGGIPNESFVGQFVDTLLEWAVEHTIWAVLAGILVLALIVALLVALLDYCMGDEEYQVPRERLHEAEELLHRANADQKKVDGKNKTD
ncbi:protein disulfide-isomerase domain [Aphanomyces invadans]|uniref:Protein disulfide-isomerase domain n=1 Tax=Aphanomyces invadans TaxID=157072 RepID=A0A024T8R0_9STRA|nr:protein disulfide-isomerase domain [Aphanomyces invadans]ETV90001.1 protein disulfide-isomerase domain [Aphanomyces invadans]|eukprot:XP_008881367.1 protein disulfide-isomerase domain [Aphanomyces invadans]